MAETSAQQIMRFARSGALHAASPEKPFPNVPNELKAGKLSPEEKLKAWNEYEQRIKEWNKSNQIAR